MFWTLTKVNFIKEAFPSMAPFIRLCWLWWPSNEAQARSSSWFPWIKPTQHYNVLTSMVTILLQSGSTGNIRHLTKLSPSQSSDQNVTPQEQWKNCSPTPQVLPRGEEGLGPSSNIVNRLQLAVKTSGQERGIRGKKVESRQSFGRGAWVWRTKGWYVGINGHWTLWRGRRRLSWWWMGLLRFPARQWIMARHMQTSLYQLPISLHYQIPELSWTATWGLFVLCAQNRPNMPKII